MVQQTSLRARIHQYAELRGQPTILCLDGRGDLLEVDGTILPPGLSKWPDVGEVWLIERHFTTWRLAYRVSVDDSNVPLSGFAPGSPTLYAAEQAELSDKHYRHVQNTAATIWTINHGLGKRPSVDVTDSANTKMYAKIEWPDENTVVLTFSMPVSGTAHLN